METNHSNNLEIESLEIPTPAKEDTTAIQK